MKETLNVAPIANSIVDNSLELTLISNVNDDPDEIRGTIGDDTLRGTEDDDAIFGEGGDDRLFGSDGIF